MHPELVNQLKRSDSQRHVDLMNEGMVDAAGVSIAIVLTMVRAVGSGTMVNAIVGALSTTADQAALVTFKSILSGGIGSTGLKPQDILSFSFSGSADMEIFLGDSSAGRIESAPLRSTLLGIYLGENTTLVPKLREDFLKHVTL